MSEIPFVSNPTLPPEPNAIEKPRRRIELLPLFELRQTGLSYYLTPHIDTPEEVKAREDLIYLPGGR